SFNRNNNNNNNNMNNINNIKTSTIPNDILCHFEHFQVLCLLRECAMHKIFDAIPQDCKTPINVEELAKLTTCHPEGIYRFLRALASYGYTKQVKINNNQN